MAPKNKNTPSKNSNEIKKDEHLKMNIIRSAPPSPQVIVFMISVAACCVYNFPSKEAYKSTATLEKLTTSNIFDDYNLGMMRAVFAFIIFATQAFVYLGPGWEEIITYPDGKRVQNKNTHTHNFFF
jgi:hypothetical protein